MALAAGHVLAQGQQDAVLRQGRGGRFHSAITSRATMSSIAASPGQAIFTLNTVTVLGISRVSWTDASTYSSILSKGDKKM